MSYDPTSLVSLGTLKNAMLRIRADYSTVIANCGYLRAQKVTEAPAPEDADAHTLYLLPDSDGEGYTIYMLIDGTMQTVGKTEVDLSDIISDEEIGRMVGDSVEEQIASDEEADEMFAEVFSPGPGEGDSET